MYIYKDQSFGARFEASLLVFKRRDRNDDAARRVVRNEDGTRSRRTRSVVRRSLSKPQVRPVLVVVADVITQEPPSSAVR